MSENFPISPGSRQTIPADHDRQPVDNKSSPEPALWVDDETGDKFAVVFDECMVRLEGGSEQRLRLDPPATRATFRQRLAALDASPIAYRQGENGSPAGLRVITRDLRVKLAGNEAPVLRGHRDLTVKSRPAYAPGWIILSAPDPLAALDSVAGLRSTAGVSQVDVLLARQQFPRLMPNDPLIGEQWHLKRSGTASPGTDINVETAWDYAEGMGVRGNGVRIGIVDDGLDLAHEDLVPNLDLGNGWDWNGNDASPGAGSGDKHGTACAGNAAARGNNGRGGSGVAPEATLVGLRLISAPSTDEQEAEAMVWKQDLIQVKSNSWGPADGGRTLEEPGPLTRAALQSATASGRGGRGTIFVWAGGNGGAVGDNSNYDGYANSIHTIAVGAVDSTGDSAGYSENGANILVCAPSDGSSPALGITTTDLVGAPGYNPASSLAGGDYAHDFGGTSSATPVVAGVVALMLQKNPQLGWRDVQEILIRSATKFRPGDAGWITNGAGIPFHPRFGAGLVNASAAVDLAAGWLSLPAPTFVSQAGSNLALPIPENSATGIARTFAFPAANVRVEHVTVTLDVSHTARGNLQVELTSPAGTVSRLAEVHGDTTDHIRNWTFSSVRNWGEEADGTWTLKISDLSPAGNSTGGTLNAAAIRIYGTETVPRNPPPVVVILSPAAASVFSPGSTVNVEVSATDLTLDGSPGQVAGVELRDNGALVGTLVAPPFRFRYVPVPGAHQLVARATDDEGATADSPPISIAVENRPPVITAVDLNAVGQAYADQELRVQSVTAADPDGNPLEFSYQWQSSTDGVFYQDLDGAGAAALAASGSNAGKLWRCQVRVSDGIHTSMPFVSAEVNLLKRPALSVVPGEVYSYPSGLVLRGDPVTPTRSAILHEFSQGPSGGNSEWIEILVLKPWTPGFWDLSDTTNTLVFSSSGAWGTIPAGTLVVVYNGTTTKDPALPADDSDPTDGRMIVSGTNPLFFDPAFDPWIPLSNNGDSIALNDPASVPIHSLCYGNSTGSPLNIGVVGSGRAAAYTGDTESGATTSAGWQSIAAGNAVTPGSPNNAPNATFIAAVKNGSAGIPARFRLAVDSVLPAGLALDGVSGLVSGTVSPEAAAGNYRIGIERTNGSGGLVSQGFVLTVGSAGGYDAWIAGFPSPANASPPGDPDFDGWPNLVEYASGTSPVLADPPGRLETGTGGLSLTYERSQIRPDVEMVPEWSSTLAPESWNDSGILIRQIGETAASRSFRATLPIDPAQSRRFLRLRAFRVK